MNPILKEIKEKGELYRKRYEKGFNPFKTSKLKQNYITFFEESYMGRKKK